MNKTQGKVHSIISNLVLVRTEGPVSQNEICFIQLGNERLMAEVIKVVGDIAYVQVFESTRGLKPGSLVEFENHMLEVTLGPGLLSKNFDGLQNDLDKMTSVFLKRGEYTNPLEEDKKWSFTPLAKVGDKVTGADWLGNVKENWLDHKIMVPFKLKGEYTVASIVAAGEYTIKDTIAVLKDEAGKEIPVTMIQKWPVKVAIRNYVDKPRPSRQMETGVRVIDTMNPILDRDSRIKLVLLDEAFSKMDQERSAVCLKYARQMDLQLIVCVPDERLQSLIRNVDCVYGFRRHKNQISMMHIDKGNYLEMLEGAETEKTGAGTAAERGWQSDSSSVEITE